MKKIFFLTNLFLTLLASPIFGQVGTPFSVTSTDSSICFGETTTLSVQSLPGTITSLTCASAINTGNLIVGTAASGVSSSIPYTGGNGGLHNGQIVTSTGVTGLTATLTAGIFSNGSGNLVFTITGTPSSTGTASFALIIGGQTCSLDRVVSSDLTIQYPVGSIFCASGPTAIVDVTNPVTGRTWMDRNLGASQVATNITDANAYGDLYQWGRKSDGHQCRTSTTLSTLSSSDAPGNNSFIFAPTSPNDWRSPQNDNLWQGLNGINNPCPSGYRIPNSTELNNEINTWSAVTILGAYSSVLKIPAAGARSAGAGTLSNVGSNVTMWTSTIESISSLGLGIGAGLINATNRSRGQSVRCIKEIDGSIGSLNCGSATVTGNLISSVEAYNVIVSVPYSGGNGGYYASQSTSSTGVTGLTAVINSGNFTAGNGSLTYTIFGTPSSSGIASFTINIGGKICTFNTTVSTLLDMYPSGSVFCASGPTVISDVTNPTTGKTWMDRNLGASQVATSSTDANAYGDLYQWGRRSDGHQCRTSATISTLSSSDQPLNGNFIITTSTPFDWRSPQSNTLWQGVNGINNPCPIGYRLPTDTELDSDRLSWNTNNSAGAFASNLKLPNTGYRNYSTAVLTSVGANAYYWSSTFSSSGTGAIYLVSSSVNGSITSNMRGNGMSVRCIKETVGSIGVLNCGSSTVTGNLISGTVVSSVSASVPYTDGNGGYYAAQSVTSTGVSGLTASITQGLFTVSTGSLVYTITGTPSSIGTASFALNIGGKTCTLNLTVVANPSNQYPAGSVFCVEPTLINDVTNPTTGKTWMDRNLGASQVASSSTDANAYGDLYQWGRRSDGHQCRTSATTSTLSSVDQPAHGNFILGPNTPFDWRSPQNTSLWQGVNGTNNPCPAGYRVPTETELTAESNSWGGWGGSNAAGAYASALKLPMAGARQSNTGSLISIGTGGQYWSSTISTTLSRNLFFSSSTKTVNGNSRSNAFAVRCIKETIGTIGALNCGSSTVTGNLITETVASSVTVSVPYTGGNGGYYAAQSVTSTGVTGLTATISQGLFTSSTGSLVYTITGTPSSTGTASFALNIGGKSCTLSIVVYGVQPSYPVSSVFCSGITTVVNDVTNPTTGKIWMDRNLGATRAATTSTDASSYGDLYEWGRRSDGHQCRTSSTTSTLSSLDVPTNGNYIMVNATPYDWRTPQNANLWQGVNGVNNPCPSGYRLPTDTELNAERLSWSANTSVGALASPLKLSMGGYRNSGDASLNFVGSYAYYWSSTASGIYGRYLNFTTSTSVLSIGNRANGNSVRCIKETIGSIGTLDCGSATLTGSLISGIVAYSVSASVPYTGGNGGYYANQSVSSTGVTGLTATISLGLFASGSGNLVYTISGTPSAVGTASFALTIGGQSCTLNLTVVPNPIGQYPVGTIICNEPTLIVDVTNPTTGKTWMDRNLGASQVASSLTDANAYGDLYQWGRRSDGHQCRNSTTTATLSSVDQPANGNFILGPTTPFDWRSPQNSNLWQGISGTNNPCPTGYRLPTETEINAERLSWSVNTSVGAFASPLKFSMTGVRRNSNGILLNVGSYGGYVTSTISGVDPRYLDFSSTGAFMSGNYRALGLAVRCIKEYSGTIGALNCGSTIVTGNLISGSAASGVSASVPYTGGNGGYYAAQSVTSTGVTGLTATLSTSNFIEGAGNLVYAITGTPSASGTASFVISIGGQSCDLSIIVYGAQPTYPVGSVFCGGITTIVNDVTNPTTGKTWMDRNLGASQVASSSTDANAYGDLYQWGRRSDGHQCRTSATTATLSSIDVPANGNFITINTGNIDWRNPQNVNLWQGINGTNNPCPSGYRLPTETEFNSEVLSWSQSNSIGAFVSPLKLPLAGNRSFDGSLGSAGTNGVYWSSIVNGNSSHYLIFTSSYATSIWYDYRAKGFSVRCIKEYNGTIGTLDCGSTTVTGNLISGTAASGVSASVPYTGGNGGYYAAQIVTSTGITGLTATISQGLFASGTGNLVYTISGTPSASGTANFALNIGGKSCTLNLTVVANPSNQYPVGTVFCTEPTLIVDVTNPTTGKIWMDRNLGATQVATSSTDANAYGDLYQWGRRADGHQCRTSLTTSTLSSVNQPGNGNFIIGSLDWRSPQNGNLWQGVNGVNNPCPSGYRMPTNAELDAELLDWSSYTSFSAFASTLKLPMAGFRIHSDGSVYIGTVGIYWLSTVSGTFSRDLYFNSSYTSIDDNNRANGFSVRCIKETVGSIGALNCGSATISGNLISGIAASGISASVPYTGGNGGFYAAQSVISTGVTGLTASISQGLFASGSGNLVYAITGTPSADGTATFALNIGGQSCTLSIATLGSYYPSGSVFCASGPTVIKDVTNPSTGKTWMDRNLGATRVATSSTDANAYGDLYQWGRRSDGHQCRTSTTTTTLSSSDTPANGNFILAPTTPFDWRSPQNNNLWQGVNGVNNPCPTGYRLPFETELNAERLSWSANNSVGAFASPLKLSMAGNRFSSNGSLNAVGTGGFYWSSTDSGATSRYLVFNSSTAYFNNDRAYGRSVRCIKD